MGKRWFERKILFSFVAGLLCLILLIAGCQKEPAAMTNAEILAKLGAPRLVPGTLAVVINEPSEEEIKAFAGIETVEEDEGDAKMLIVPVYEGASLRLEQIIWSNAKGTFVKGRTVFEKEGISGGEALYLQAYRPEGMPELRIVIKADTESGTEYGQYLISYNGKEGNQKFENIDASIEAAAIWQEAQGNVAVPEESEPEAEESEGQAAALNYEEVVTVFEMTEEDLYAQFGQPTEQRSEEFFEGVYYKHLYYGESEFALDDEGVVFLAVLADNLLPAPRGISIGDDYEAVLDKFPNEKGEIKSDPYDPEYKEQLLYGSGSYMTNYGKIIYNNEQPAEIVYATAEGVTLRFILDKGKVYRIEYAMPMT